MLRSVTLGLCLLVLSGCTSAGSNSAPASGSAEPVTVRIGYQSGWVPNANVGVTLEREDMLAQRNLKGSFVPLADGPQLSEAILGSKLDIALQGDGPTMSLLARKAPVKILGKLVDYKGQLLVSADGPITSVADLRGRRIGALLGSGAYRQLLDWLVAAGLNPERDVQIINLGTAEWLPALYSGQVDAFAGWAPATVQPLLEGRARSIQSGWSRGLLLTTDKFVAEHPAAVNDFVKAYREAIWTMSRDRDVINAAVADVSKQPLNVVQAATEEDRNYREAKSLDDVVVRLSEDELNDLQSFGDFLFEQKRLDSRPDVRGALLPGPVDQAEKPR